eukprot:scaffold3450_cov114-Cylindrotheca_fusiformis.AAC.46
MEDPKAANKTNSITSGFTPDDKPPTNGKAKVAAGKLDSRIAGRRGDVSRLADREAKERARMRLGPSFGSYRTLVGPNSKEFKKKEPNALLRHSSNRHLKAMTASLDFHRKPSTRFSLSSFDGTENIDLKQPPPAKPRSSSSGVGLSIDDIEAKARARASFYSSAVRLDITQLSAKSKMTGDSSDGSQAIGNDSESHGRRPPRLGIAGSNPEDLQKHALSLASTATGRLSRAASKRNISDRPVSTTTKQVDVADSELTKIRDLDALLAFKTGIPLDQVESESRPVAVLGRKRPVSSSIVVRNRLPTPGSPSLSSQRITDGMDADELVAYKTRIPLDSESQQSENDDSDDFSHESSNQRHTGSFCIASKRTGITSSRDLDQLIAFKTGIPIEEEEEDEKEEMVVRNGRNNAPKSPVGSLDVEKRSTVETKGNLPVPGNKMGYYPNCNKGKEKGGDVEDLRDTSDLAVATEVLEETEDAFIPSAIEYDAEAKPPIYKNRRFRLYSALTACLVIVVTVAMVKLFASKKTADKNQPNITDPEKEKDLTMRAQLELVVGSEQLNDSRSPQYRAMTWLMNDDPMQLGTEDENLVQRFLLASFYIHSHDYGDWVSCNAPNATAPEDTCFYQQVVDLYPRKYRSVPSYRWLSGEHECQWAGLGCDESDYLRTIDLFAQQVRGTLPAELTKLRFLQGIRFNLNELHGTLPEEFGLMHHLVHLELHFNFLTGSLPNRWSEARSLQAINIGENFLTGTIPSGIEGNVKDLRLSSSALNGTIPEELFSLLRLSRIDLFKSGLTGTLSTRVGQMENLSILRIHDNSMYGEIPDTLGQISDLSSLWVQGNSFTGDVPLQLCTLKDVGGLEQLVADCLPSNITGIAQNPCTCCDICCNVDSGFCQRQGT